MTLFFDQNKVSLADFDVLPLLLLWEMFLYSHKEKRVVKKWLLRLPVDHDFKGYDFDSTQRLFNFTVNQT